MLKFKLQRDQFDGQRWLRDLQRNVEGFRDAAARVFIRSTFTKVPTWSGASRASLIPLSNLVQQARQQGFIKDGTALGSLEKFIKPRAFAPKDFPRNDKHHSIPVGDSRGRGSKITDGNLKASFLFSTTVLQYFLLEEEWDSIPFGTAAMERFIVRHMKDVFPEWGKYFKSETVVIG